MVVRFRGDKIPVPYFKVVSFMANISGFDQVICGWVALSKDGDNTGWPKSCDPNVQAYCGLIIYSMNQNLPEMRSFHQPFEEFTKVAQKFVHFLFIFFSFQSFSATSDQLLLLIHITSCLALKK